MTRARRWSSNVCTESLPPLLSSLSTLVLRSSEANMDRPSFPDFPIVRSLRRYASHSAFTSTVSWLYLLMSIRFVNVSSDSGLISLGKLSLYAAYSSLTNGAIFVSKYLCEYAWWICNSRGFLPLRSSIAWWPVATGLTFEWKPNQSLRRYTNIGETYIYYIGKVTYLSLHIDFLRAHFLRRPLFDVLLSTLLERGCLDGPPLKPFPLDLCPKQGLCLRGFVFKKARYIIPEVCLLFGSGPFMCNHRFGGICVR